jgi:hypothetical protein
MHGNKNGEKNQQAKNPNQPTNQKKSLLLSLPFTTAHLFIYALEPMSNLPCGPPGFRPQALGLLLS